MTHVDLSAVEPVLIQNSVCEKQKRSSEFSHVATENKSHWCRKKNQTPCETDKQFYIYSIDFYFQQREDSRSVCRDGCRRRSRTEGVINSSTSASQMSSSVSHRRPCGRIRETRHCQHTNGFRNMHEKFATIKSMFGFICECLQTSLSVPECLIYVNLNSSWAGDRLRCLNPKHIHQTSTQTRWGIKNSRKSLKTSIWRSGDTEIRQQWSARLYPVWRDQICFNTLRERALTCEVRLREI